LRTGGDHTQQRRSSDHQWDGQQTAQSDRHARPQSNARPGIEASLQRCGSDGCVAKNKSGHKNTERYFSSGGNLEEIGHESNLSANVAFPDSFNLSLPDHVHGLITADGSPRRVETEEAESGIDSAFYESVILLDDIIEIFALA